MSKNVAVILSGCGVYDGSEIHEAVLTLLSLEQQGAHYQCFAPDINQHHVIDHITGDETSETRNVLIESARIARGDIKTLGELNADQYDALILPGGFGAAKNLSSFAFHGSEFTIQEEVTVAVKAFAKQSKPVGLMCIAPAMAGKLFGKGVKATVGNDPDTSAQLEQTGVYHVSCSVDEIIVDEQHKLVTTPAYMLAQSIGEAYSGIQKLVGKVLSLA